jgi:hypothetical protein
VVSAVRLRPRRQDGVGERPGIGGGAQAAEQLAEPS